MSDQIGTLNATTMTVTGNLTANTVTQANVVTLTSSVTNANIVSGVVTLANVITQANVITLATSVTNANIVTLANVVTLATSVTNANVISQVNAISSLAGSATQANVITQLVGTVTTANVVQGVVTLGTNVATTSGTSIDFTGIAAGAKQIVIGLRGVSFNLTSKLVVQLGDAGGIETTSDYTYRFYHSGGDGSDSPPKTYFTLSSNSILNTCSLVGVITLVLVDAATFTWMINSIVYNDIDSKFCFVIGYKSLTAELTQLRLTTAVGTSAFDAGCMNIQVIR